MKIEEFVSINRSLGHTIKKVRDYYFRSQRDTGFPFPVYSAFPIEKKVDVNRSLARVLSWRFLITQVFFNLPKKDIHEFVLTTNKYEIEQFSKNERKSIRKALRVFSTRKPSMEDLLNEGFIINKQTCERQSRTDERMMDYKKWSQYVKTIYNCSGFTILGAYLEKRMVGYLVVYELEGKFQTDGAFIDRNYTGGASPMKALLFTCISDLIIKGGTVTLSYGYHRFFRPTSLTTFKENMLFQKYSYAKGYIVNPLLLLGLNMTVFIMIKILKRKSFKQKLGKEIIYLYQGHRRLKEALRLNHPA